MSVWSGWRGPRQRLAGPRARARVAVPPRELVEQVHVARTRTTEAQRRARVHAELLLEERGHRAVELHLVERHHVGLQRERHQHLTVVAHDGVHRAHLARHRRGSQRETLPRCVETTMRHRHAPRVEVRVDHHQPIGQRRHRDERAQHREAGLAVAHQRSVVEGARAGGEERRGDLGQRQAEGQARGRETRVHRERSGVRVSASVFGHARIGVGVARAATRGQETDDQQGERAKCPQRFHA